MDPRVSVIIPAYNCENTVREAVESAYSQTVPPAEVIVVNDGSTDTTESILVGLAPSFPSTFRWITKQNSGPGSARNVGVRLATGDFVTFLDSDDLWASGKTARQLEQFASDPQLTLSFTGRIVVTQESSMRSSALTSREGGAANYSQGFAGALAAAAGDAQPFRTTTTPDPEAVLESLMAHPTIGSSSVVMVRREAFNRVPRFKEKTTVDDWTMWLQMATAGMRFGFIPEPLVKYRWHGDNLTGDRLRQLADICAMLDHFDATTALSRRVRRRTRIRWWRAHWHLVAAIEALQRGQVHEARGHILCAVRIHPPSVRPGWARMLGIGLAPPS
jgi:glycosyltransferase involved in cell wall biosynthesis